MIISRPEDSRRGHAVQIGLLAVLLGIVLPAMLTLFFVGFQSSDDANYLVGALGWLNQFPYVGDTHWTLRHTITIPTALAIAALGLSEFAVALTGIAYFTAFICINARYTWRYLGPTSAVVATLMMLTLPGFPIVGTYLSPDVPELFFVTFAFWLFRAALDDGPRIRLFVFAGMVAGLGYINRPTAAALPIFLAILWLVRPMVPRARYLPMAAAFLAVIVVDWSYLMLMTHQPFYRANIDLHHDTVDRFAEAAETARQHRWIDREGNLSVNVWVDPILALFASQKYALVFWLSLPAALAAWAARRDPGRRTLLLIGGLGLISFLFVALNPKLYLVPRYLLVVAWAATSVAAWWIATLWNQRRRGLAVALTLAGLAVALLGLSVEDTSPRAVERALVRWVAAHPGDTIYTDVETRARSEFLFRFAKAPWDDVKDEKAPPGALFFYNADRVTRCENAKRCRDRRNDFQPQPTWTTVATIPGPVRPGAVVLDWLGLKEMLPQDVRKRIFASASTVTVYRVR